VSSGPRPCRRLSRSRLALAFTIAALADALAVFLALTPPVQWSADLVTAIALFVVLGWQWYLLPALIMEAIPGLYVFPFWVLVVGAVAMWGAVWPGRKTIDRREEPHGSLSASEGGGDDLHGHDRKGGSQES
jgi:lysylphosphatidylglycerol synthetase-like protein (DUF2156 family)